MRRAAERSKPGARPEPAADVDILGRESFPDERDDHQHVNGSVNGAVLEPVSHVEAPEPLPMDGPRELVKQRATTLFEHMDIRLAQKVVVDQNMMAASREQYRRLAAALHHAQLASGLKVVMISSAVAGEGKTLTASNLALTLSESYQRTVLLIDGDLRRPSLDTVFQLDGSSGLSEGLIAFEERKMPLHAVSPTLSVLPAGRATSDPMAGLTSERMARLIAEAREAFEWVIIDTPPVGLLSDAKLLAAMADGTVLVVKADSTPYDLVQRAIHALGREKVLGAVLNRATEGARRSDYGYYNYYYGNSNGSSNLSVR
jgi:capsular exopolysaccharide synthesis family protein